MTRTEAMAYLMADGNLRVPCSRYGSDTEDCAVVALRVAELYAAETGESMTTEDLEHAMGLVVNDHDDVEYLIRAYGEPADLELLESGCEACGMPYSGSHFLGCPKVA